MIINFFVKVFFFLVTESKKGQKTFSEKRRNTAKKKK